MTYDPGQHHRRSIRLSNYDYTQPSCYFVTVCTQGRGDLFGEVVEGEMRPNDAGRMVRGIWDELSVFYPGVNVDEFVVMPNHVHGIIVLKVLDSDESGQAQGPAPTNRSALSLPEVVHRFKTMTTKRYAEGVRNSGWLPFDRRLWQRNYCEHVIRNDAALERLRRYIVANPSRWNTDGENLLRVTG